ncbi:MAG: hypothetical protein FWE42_09315 [Defluviitaleaceae bacterium]|nr:hypothetical protein [Defluviitaleaceae bacterium]
MKDLDKINWNRLYHAYGIATDTPSNLKNLFSNDAAQRNDAIGVTVYIVPCCTRALYILSPQ